MPKIPAKEFVQSFVPRTVANVFCGRPLFVRSPSGKDQEAWEAAARDQSPDGVRGRNLIRAMAVCISLCDEAGELVFDYRTDLDYVAELPWTELDAVYAKMKQMNGETEEEEAAAKKNS